MERLNDTAIIQAILDEFYDLCRFPHGSGNEAALGAYLYDTLEQMCLNPERDEYGNLYCDVPAISGAEGAPLTILQAHMDMVVAAADGFRPEQDLVRPMLDRTVLRTDGRSSLGADNGIGMAAILYLLKLGAKVRRGPVRILFTVGEEVGLQGAEAVDPARLSGAKYLINTDGFHQKDLIVASCGGIEERFARPVEAQSCKNAWAYQIVLDGFKGGHSGFDIDRGRVNAIKLMGRLLDTLRSRTDFELSALEGGTAQNAIPSECTATVVLPDGGVQALTDTVAEYNTRIAELYPVTDGKGACSMRETDLPETVWSKAARDDVINLIVLFENGVSMMNPYFAECVGASSNLAVVGEERHCVTLRSKARFYTRCAVDSILIEHARAAELTDFAVTYHHAYPEWFGTEDNPLAEMMDQVYFNQAGRSLNLTATHVGLEASTFKAKAPELTAVCCGVDILDAHTVAERVLTESIAPFFRMICGTLETIAGDIH